MANIVYRLPGREQYSYAEVTFNTDDPEYVDPASRLEVLQGALADLDLVYPAALARAAQPEPQDARPAAPAGGKSNGADTTCVHGPRNRVAKANWVAWFCPQPQGATDQCKAAFEKRG